ncbi:hypothetical protein TELCIR_04959 [Teladorsagia circumcincta]|uniref:Uncharacterized protein n=1 Tax=Teladorsagia circumcincta TaxID=45464 RepID=A0A2G9UU84_TELCI|nr:hypothetical protein TELCIR_04959 [Teladorsagia circumcincta]
MLPRLLLLQRGAITDEMLIADRMLFRTDLYQWPMLQNHWRRVAKCLRWTDSHRQLYKRHMWVVLMYFVQLLLRMSIWSHQRFVQGRMWSRVFLLQQQLLLSVVSQRVLQQCACCAIRPVLCEWRAPHWSWMFIRLSGLYFWEL